MTGKFSALYQKYGTVFAYLVVGVLTTVVNFLVYYPLYPVLRNAAVANSAAWLVSASFAYVANKIFVFRSRNWSAATVLCEAGKFFGCRLGTGVFETGILFVAVDLWRWDGNIVKLAVSLFAVVINYVASKLFVFHKNS